MTTIERIQQQLQKLPEPLHREVLDFIEFLITKTERESMREELDAWSHLSLGLALRGMQEDGPDYSLEDLKEKFH